MHPTMTCTACSGQRFAVRVLVDGRGWRLRAVPLPAFSRAEAGRFEAWICLGCGYTAIYAQQLPEDIEALAKQFPDELRIVDAGPPEQGPYR